MVQKNMEPLVLVMNNSISKVIINCWLTFDSKPFPPKKLLKKIMVLILVRTCNYNVWPTTSLDKILMKIEHMSSIDGWQLSCFCNYIYNYT
jgi:hypothetical protein